MKPDEDVEMETTQILSGVTKFLKTIQSRWAQLFMLMCTMAR